MRCRPPSPSWLPRQRQPSLGRRLATLPAAPALSAAQLNATASVPGTFEYTPAEGEVLAAGRHTLTVTFTPKDETSYTTAQAAVTINVSMATPADRMAGAGSDLLWYTAQCRSAQRHRIGSRQFRLQSLRWRPARGGNHTLEVTFTPKDSANYATAQASVSITVAKAKPAIAWPTPDPIIYGTRLGAAQLSATASVPGKFIYNPGLGAVLAAGEHTPSVTFTPDDSANYTTARTAVSLTVVKAEPIIAWPMPNPIICGTALSAMQLCAAASVPGSFVYTPAAGDILSAGDHTLSVTFTPADTMNYKAAHASVLLIVTETTPTLISWPAPAPITYGTALSSFQLNAVAPIQGSFAYTPSEGDLLPVGRHTLSVTFTPVDTEKYAIAHASVPLLVEALPNIESLLTTAAQTPRTQPRAADQSYFVDAKRKPVTSINPPHQNIQRETRTYKGAIYEKGDDGQWHLQQK